MKTTQVPDLNLLRVETALSRFPVHRLTKGGTVDIEIHETRDDGETILKWEVSHNSRYGQPGPLAYAVDMLVVNRRLEEAGRPVPELVRLGSLREIAEMTGTGHGNTERIKKALRQNSSAYIDAKLTYKTTDGTQRSVEIGNSRYGVIFSGESLPDGRRADGVYLVLNSFYREILDSAVTRPLDYEYLRELPPASQRWYELASFPMFGAVKHRKPARLSYAEFSMHAPQIRHETWDRVRRQMADVHAPHLTSGYIAAVEFVATTHRDGGPDWSMIYRPGPRALGRVLEVTEPAVAQPLPAPVPAPRRPKPDAKTSEPSLFAKEAADNPLVVALADRGITWAEAERLVGAHDAAKITTQIDVFDHLMQQKAKGLKANPPGWLRNSIENGFPIPPSYQNKAKREKKAADDEARKAAEDVERQQRAHDREEAAKLANYWAALSAEEKARIDDDALAVADADMRRAFEEAKPTVKRLLMAGIRDEYLRSILQDQPQAA